MRGQIGVQLHTEGFRDRSRLHKEKPTVVAVSPWAGVGIRTSGLLPIMRSPRRGPGVIHQGLLQTIVSMDPLFCYTRTVGAISRTIILITTSGWSSVRRVATRYSTSGSLS